MKTVNKANTIQGIWLTVLLRNQNLTSSRCLISNILITVAGRNCSHTSSTVITHWPMWALKIFKTHISQKPISGILQNWDLLSDLTIPLSLQRILEGENSRGASVPRILLGSVKMSVILTILSTTSFLNRNPTALSQDIWYSNRIKPYPK